ncbi:MAG TPA: NAD(P)/FAD-dependent oxidoreductase, partial [Candidatus Dormibacteraeota bacterium]|nr:NAD(P)/FAD-dependent oxidoreductase [Candidatus Dormibacteraeota bacterium]
TARAWDALGTAAVAAERIVGATVSSTEVRLGSERTVVVGHRGAEVRMVRRRDLDRLLLEEAMAAGAEVRTEEAAATVEVTRDGCAVTTAAGEYRAGHLLLATGSEGRLRREAGLRAPKAWMVPALEIEAAATVESVAGQDAILDFGVPRGYAWAFPKGAEWNIGILSLDHAVGPSLRGELARFVERAGVRFANPDALRAVKGRRIPMWTGRGRVAAGRAAALGDSAGLADAFFGEGISHALISGRLAADAILADPAADLEGYSRDLRRRLAPHLTGMLAMSRIAYRWPERSVAALGASRSFRWIVRRAVFGSTTRPTVHGATSRAA